MDALNAIFNRRSIRKYTNQHIDDDTVNLLIKAGMAAPTCVNSRDWHFVVIRSREHMEKIMQLKPINADMLREASVAIMVCGDMSLAYSGNPDYWIQDCSAATQNILIAATSLGIGSVWLGVWPNEKRSQALREYFGLAQTLVPFSIISLGYPGEQKAPKNLFDTDKIDYID